MEQYVKCTKPDCDCVQVAVEKNGGVDVKSYPCLAYKNALEPMPSEFKIDRSRLEMMEYNLPEELDAIKNLKLHKTAAQQKAGIVQENKSYGEQLELWEEVLSKIQFNMTSIDTSTMAKKLSDFFIIKRKLWKEL